MYPFDPSFQQLDLSSAETDGKTLESVEVTPDILDVRPQDHLGGGEPSCTLSPGGLGGPGYLFLNSLI